MKLFHINLGILYSQPYESDYAVIRRCLIANSGVPYTAIAGVLRETGYTRTTIAERLRRLQPTSPKLPMLDVIQPSHSFRRQCPQCAKHAYHTDIFTIPWLTHCPIHQCELTTTCPDCKRPWPNKHEIQKRDCTICGLIPIKSLGLSVIPFIKQNPYKPIKTISDIVCRTNKDVTFNLIDIQKNEGDDVKTWWDTVPIISNLFPSFASRIHPRLSKNISNRLQLPITKIASKRSKLIRDQNADVYFKWRPYHRDRPFPDTLKKSGASIPIDELKADCHIMRFIINWIVKNTAAKHQLQISSYRYLTMRYWMNAPPPCPYCLAFSLLFFRISSEYYPDRIINWVHDYEFLNEMRFFRFHDRYKPSISIERKAYRLETNFVNWFYSRGREIAFIDILKFVFFFIKMISLFRNKSYHLKPLPRFDRRFSDRYCWSEIYQHQYYFYYENEHPLLLFKPEPIKNLVKRCENYHKYHDENKLDRNEIEFDDVRLSKITAHQYLALQNRFLEYLNQCFA